METIHDWGIDVVLWFQQFSPHLDGIFEALTFLGDEEFYLILLPLVYWSIHRATGVRLMILVMFSSLLNTVAKSLAGQPRPFEYDGRVLRLDDSGGYGLPSGHTQSSVVLWGFVALESRRRWMWTVAGLTATGVALSRIYLGVHFPTDVIGGALLGIAVLLAWQRYGGRSEDWFRRQALSRRMLLAVVAPLVVVAVFPEEDVVTAAGTFVGLATGVILERHVLRFSTDGSVMVRTARFVVGGAVLVAIWWGLRQAFDGLEPSLLLRLIRYTLVGLWGTFGAPWLFLRLGLAHPESPFVRRPVPVEGHSHTPERE